MSEWVKHRVLRRIFAVLAASVMLSCFLMTGCSKSKTTTCKAALFSTDVPAHFEVFPGYDEKRLYEYCDYLFTEDSHKSQAGRLKLIIKTETAYEFERRFKDYFSMSDYTAGNMPIRRIAGYDFVEVTRVDFLTEKEETHFVYRYEAASMTIWINLSNWPQDDSYDGWVILDHLKLKLPDYGYSDPSFAFETEKEHSTRVSEMSLNDYTITPVQGHFSDLVYDLYGGVYIPKSSTAIHAAASEKYLYTYDEGPHNLYVYKINGEEMTLVTTVYEMNARGKKGKGYTVELPDNDSLTIYKDSEVSPYYFLVENCDGKETFLSYDEGIAISPDGKTIVCDLRYSLHIDPQTKEVTSEPFTLDETRLQTVRDKVLFITDKNMYVRAYDMDENKKPTTCRLFKYDLDGNFICELEREDQMVTNPEMICDFGEDILIMNTDLHTIELWDKEAEYLAGVPLENLIGTIGGEAPYHQYSLLRRGNEGDFILIIAYADHILELTPYTYAKEGILYEGEPVSITSPAIMEDLVYQIQIG